MNSTKCLRCGWANSAQDVVCERCGEELLRGQEYENSFAELKEYEELRRRFGIPSIVVGILMLLLLCPAAQWFFVTVPPPSASKVVVDLVQEYAPPVVILLLFLIIVLPLILGRWRILRRHRWTKERMRALDGRVRGLPKDFFQTPALEGQAPQGSSHAIKGPPTVLLVVIFGLLALVTLDEYVGLGVLDTIRPLVGIEQVATVSGEYQRHYDAADLGGGVARTEQTWSYVFQADGTYTTSLDGHQQYSGTWSQSGSALTVNIPAIPGMGTPARPFHATVSRGGDSFTAGEEAYTRVR